MAVSLLNRQTKLKVPAHWPAALHPQALGELKHATPYLITDLETVRDRYTRFMENFPSVRCFYAVKCNSSPEVLETMVGLGSSFEVASLQELDMLRRLGVDPRDVLYSNTVKPSSHIAGAHERGLWRFAFDSEGELYKLARHAPGASVYVRMRVDDSTSSFPLSRKFGAEASEAKKLMTLASQLGLRPYGVTFHVGSQCATTTAWRQAIACVARLLDDLGCDGIELEMIDLGGGFPARYVDEVPSLEQIAGALFPALDELLPYRPRLLAAEPGRAIVAESAVLVASVLGREVRAGECWLYLDVGAYNGLMETQQTVNEWRYPLWTSLADHAKARQIPYTVTGPTCDSNDTMFFGAALPENLNVDDKLYIGSTGAYTLSYASNFNGFPPPTQVYVGKA